MRTFLCVGLSAILFLESGCIPETPVAPTEGYGEPYRGVAKPIYVKDSRTDWSISEAGKPITSEHALEATNDAEYLTRRQLMKEYNQKLYEEGLSHHSTGTFLYLGGTGLAIAGFAVGIFLPSVLRDATSTPASASSPEQHELKPGAASDAALYGGFALALVGIGLAIYGFHGGSVPPPYYKWHTPDALNRPAYIRERTEPYNEKMGAPPVQDQPGSVESVPLAPGQRKPPPPRPTGKSAPAGAR